MAKVFCVDVSRCSGCYNCQFACKDEHYGNEWLPFAKKQPLVGQFWLKIDEHVQGSTPKVHMYYVPHLCNHCDRPACAAAAEGGAVYKRDDGLVIIDPLKSEGQRQIVDACPYGAVYWNEELNIPQKCTGCAHLLAEGKVPRCVDVCQTDALRFGEEEDFKDFIQSANQAECKAGCSPRVYYKGIPKEFISGTVYDPEEEEVIKGARCTLTGTDTTFEVFTDTFGDFWFKELPEGRYNLRIEAKGFAPRDFFGIESKGSVCLEDIPLEKTAKENKVPAKPPSVSSGELFGPGSGVVSRSGKCCRMTRRVPAKNTVILGRTLKENSRFKGETYRRNDRWK